jgi:hypothetical protein
MLVIIETIDLEKILPVVRDPDFDEWLCFQNILLNVFVQPYVVEFAVGTKLRNTHFCRQINIIYRLIKLA